MLLSEIAVVERHEHHSGRYHVTHLRGSDHGSTTRDDADTVAIKNATVIGIGDVDGHENSWGCVVELRRFTCLCSRVPVVRLTTADRDCRKSFIRRLERRLVLGRHEHGAPSWGACGAG